MPRHTPDILADLMSATPGQNAVAEIPIALIDDNPFQKREDYGDLTDLANDIREHGVMSPPVARPVAGGRYELAFGHRRKRACELANRSTMPLLIRALTDEQMATMAYSENEQRADVSPIDKANAIQCMIACFGWTHQQVADKLNVSRPAVSNLLRLLRLPADLQTAVSAGEISVRQAEALIPLVTMPAEARQRLTKYDSLETLVEDAKRGQSSEDLRGRVTAAMSRATSFLPDHWRNYSFEDAGVQQPLCTGCPHIVRVRDEDRCSLLSCWTAKSSAWQAIEHAPIIEATGTSLVPESVQVDDYTCFYGRERVLLDLPAIADKPPSHQCPNLRLRHAYGEKWEFVCYHPGQKSCACLRKAQTAANRSGKHAWQEIRASVEQALTIHLAEFPLNALRLLARSYCKWDQREQVSSWDAAQCIPVVVSGLIQTFAPYAPQENHERARVEMQKLLTLAGLASPWIEENPTP